MQTKEDRIKQLRVAIEIAKEFGRGGSQRDPDYLIQVAYDKISEIIAKIDSDK